MPTELKTIEDVKNCSYVQNINKLLDKKKFAVSNKNIQELLNFIIDLNIKDFKDDESINKLLEIFQIIQSYRNRVFKIHVYHIVIRRELISLQKQTKAWSLHIDPIKKLKTVGDRMAAQEDIFSKLENKIQKVKNILDACELADANLKASYFTIKEMKDIAIASYTNSSNYEQTM